jgi:hypothetical protein
LRRGHVMKLLLCSFLQWIKRNTTRNESEFGHGSERTGNRSSLKYHAGFEMFQVC